MFLLKLKRFDRLDEKKKNIHIFGVRMFTVYVEASIGSCCFIPVLHHIRNSFLFFALSVEMPLGAKMYMERRRHM